MNQNNVQIVAPRVHAPRAQQKPFDALGRENKIAMDDVAGPEMLTFLNTSFGHLRDKLYINNRYRNLAAPQKFFKDFGFGKIFEGYLQEKDSIVDLGSEASKLHEMNLGDRVHSMQPVRDGYDELVLSQASRAGYAGHHCSHKFGVDWPLNCACNRVVKYMTAIESIHKDGAFAKLRNTLHRNDGATALLSFYDYDWCRREGKGAYAFYDKSGEVIVERDRHGYKAVVSVKGQPVLEQQIFNTDRDIWQYQCFDSGHMFYLVFQVKERLLNGQVPYLVVEVTKTTYKVPGATHFVDFFVQAPLLNIETQVVIDVEADYTREAVELIKRSYGSELEEVTVKDDNLILSINSHPWYKRAYATLRCKKVERKIVKAPIKEVAKSLPSMMGKFEPADIVRETRKGLSDVAKVLETREALGKPTNGVMTLSMIAGAEDKLLIAQNITSGIAGRTARYVNTSEVVQTARRLYKGLDTSLTINFGELLKWSLIMMFFVCSMLYLRVTAPKTVGVEARSNQHTETELETDWIWMFFVALLVALLKSIKFDKHKDCKDAYWDIAGSCVFDKKRLRPAANMRFDPKFKYRDDSWRPENLECNIPDDRIYAHQVGPVIDYPNKRIGVVKKPCKCCAAAAMYRACSNQVTFDPIVIADWERWFNREIIEKRFMKFLDQKELYISIDVWKMKYTEKIRAMVDAAVKSGKVLDVDETFHDVYQSFPKVELQKSAVAQWLRETIENTVKERQISGPGLIKKILVNPIINALEHLAHEFFPEYCGMKDWPGIAKTIWDGMCRLRDCLMGAADGSGFDMTQFRRMNQRMNELIRRCITHINCTLAAPLDVEIAMIILNDAILLDVDVGRGAVNYKAEGRASGDGWTTFGNTVLMISYWLYTFEKAGLLPHQFFLLVKGDDVLFGIERELQPVVDAAVHRYFHMEQAYRSHGLGQICKFIKYGDIEEMDFLSSHFFRTTYGLRMVRIPENILQGMSWTTKLPRQSKDQEADRRSLCYAKGMSLLAWSKGLPIWEELAHAYIRVGKEGKLTDWCQYTDAPRVAPKECHSDRQEYAGYLCKMYGVTVMDIEKIEAKLRSIKVFNEIVDIPEMEMLCSPAA